MGNYWLSMQSDKGKILNVLDDLVKDSVIDSYDLVVKGEIVDHQFSLSFASRPYTLYSRPFKDSNSSLHINELVRKIRDGIILTKFQQVFAFSMMSKYNETVLSNNLHITYFASGTFYPIGQVSNLKNTQIDIGYWSCVNNKLYKFQLPLDGKIDDLVLDCMKQI